ncbi:MAG TPA: phosphonate ABC transporter substrate-binding protein [Xanthobacteraceae bacterium]|nr:phosphonate ABC transporter substrate-binding protein [Xanthobacteraceae bacterium]
MMRAFLTCAVAAVTVAASAVAAGAQAPAEINFGVISTEASMNQKKNWEPFLQAMSKAVGIKVNGFYATDYAGVIEAMRFNKIHVAWYGNKSGMEAVDRANGEVFAHTVGRDGSVGYYSHIIVHKDSSFTKLEDVLKCDKSLDFGIGDPNSTSGFLVPTAYIFATRNLDPKTCFKTVRNANHQANAMAVANKQVAAATNNSEDLQRLAASAPAAREQIKIVWTSPLIPLDPLVWRKDLDPALKAKVYTFLMSYGRIGTEDETKIAKGILADLIWSPFRPSSDNQLIPIRVLEANKNLMKVQGDDKLSADEKSKQVAAIRAEIAKLEEMQKKAESDQFQKRVAAFVETDKTGNQDDLKKMIAEFAAGTATTH